MTLKDFSDEVIALVNEVGPQSDTTVARELIVAGLSRHGLTEERVDVGGLVHYVVNQFGQ